MNIQDIFQTVNDFLPKDVKAKAVSIYPLPYPRFNEVFVEGTDGKRYRALANDLRTISEFTEFQMPGGVSNVK